MIKTVASVRQGGHLPQMPSLAFESSYDPDITVHTSVVVAGDSAVTQQ